MPSLYFSRAPILQGICKDLYEKIMNTLDKKAICLRKVINKKETRTDLSIE